MSSLRRWAVVVVAGAAVALGGCTKPNDQAGHSTTGPDKQSSTAAGSASLQVKGSDTMVQLAQAWAEEFAKTHKGVNVSVTGGGSSTGIKALQNKSTDIANASRPMTKDEKASVKDLKEYVVAQDALSIIVNPSNTVTELTMAQLRDIYTGKVANWKDVGGPNQKIVINSRETSSGSYAFFQEHVLGKGTPYAATALLQPATSQIVQNVAQDKGGVGYVGLGYVNSTVKAVKVKKTPADPAVLGSEATVLDGTYPLARPLFEYVSGEPSGSTKDWLDWVRGPDGQAIVKKLGFVAVK